MINSKIIIWGASGHALVVADIIRLENKFEIAGFLDDLNSERASNEFCGARIWGGREQLETPAMQGISYLLFGFGDCKARLHLTPLVRALGLQLGTAIHPRSIVAAGVTIGAGTVVAAGAVVNPGVSIGENVIINTCASVDHECVIEDGVHICPGVRLAGRVKVGRGSFIGVGATVVSGVSIGADTIIGAGSVVVKHIPNRVVAYGVPAKIVKDTSRETYQN